MSSDGKIDYNQVYQEFSNQDKDSAPNHSIRIDVRIEIAEPVKNQNSTRTTNKLNETDKVKELCEQLNPNATKRRLLK